MRAITCILNNFSHTRYNNLRFHPGIEILILPILSLEGCTLVALKLTHMVVKWHHCYVKVMSSCYIAFQHNQELLWAYWKLKKLMRNLMTSKIFLIICVMMGSKNLYLLITICHQMARLVLQQIFLSHPHTHNRFLYYYFKYIGKCC